MNKSFLIFFSIIALILYSCKESKEVKITGYYEIDKTVSRNRANNIPDYRFLIINKDSTFELRNNRNDSIGIIKGKLEYENINSEERTVKFIYDNKQVTGTLKGTIFYFIYPNDFHNDKYENLLYVKLKE